MDTDVPRKRGRRVQRTIRSKSSSPIRPRCANVSKKGCRTEGVRRPYRTDRKLFPTRLWLDICADRGPTYDSLNTHQKEKKSYFVQEFNDLF